MAGDGEAFGTEAAVAQRGAAADVHPPIWAPGVEREIAISSSRHVGRDVGEQRRAEIALAGVGQHAEDGRALRRLGGDLQRAGEGGARR